MRLPRLAGLLVLAPAIWAQYSLTITTSSLPNGTVGVNYFATISSTGSSSSTWSVSGLPAGIAIIGSATGSSVNIGGSPTTGGTYGVVARVTDPEFDDEQVTKTFSVTISSPPLSFATTSPLPPAMVGVLYDTQFTANGGSPPLTYSALTLPPGLQLGSGGSLSGVPTSASNYNFNVTVTDSGSNHTTAPFVINVTPALLFGTPSPLPAGSAGAPYSQTINISGGTSPYTFQIPSTSTPPPGINISKSGNVAGTPTAIGTYSFVVQVTDNLGFVATKTYGLTINAGTPLLQVSPLSLTFTSFTGGDIPQPQAVSIVSTNSTAVQFSTTTDAGAGTGAPPWLVVSPATGTAPARMLVSVIPSMLQGTSGQANIHLSVVGNTTQVPITIAVTFSITTASPMLQASPPGLRFGARFAAPGVQQQALIVNNAAGGGMQSFTVSVVGNSPWLSVTPSTGQAGNSTVLVLQVKADSTGLAVGDHHDIIQVTGPNAVQIPVDIFVATSGPLISLSETGLRFLSRQGSGSMRPQSVSVLNLGDTSSTVNWSATLETGTDWITLQTSSGTATPAQPGVLTMVPNSSVPSDPAGPRYALVQVTDKNALNSPQYLAAVLDNEPSASPALPDPSPGGLYFTSKTGPQQILVYTSSATQTAFATSVVTNDGSSWLSASPSSGVASTASPGVITVSVTPPSAQGIYSGYVNIAMSGDLVVANITLVVLPAGTTNSPSERPLATSSCTPAQLAMTETGLVNNFSVPAGWPATLIAQLNDNCGNSVAGGSIVVGFSNGDAPLALAGTPTSNTYSATWQPGAVYPSMTITLRATAGTLPPLTQVFTGTVNSNPTPPPVLLPNGTLDIFFDGPTAASLGAGLAPGNVVQVYGSGLGASLVGAPTIPLPTSINGTYMLVGQDQAPLYFISSSVLAAEIPFELTPNQQYSAIASVNNALSLPITVTVVPVQPGIAVRTDGTAEAQHTADYSLVTAANPAKPGETVVIYLAGMGATNPSVASGAPTPPQLVPTTVQPTVTLDSQNVKIAYAGLTPTGIGLYQIDFVIPSNAKSGNLNVIVTQNGVVSNNAILPVSN